MNNNQIDNLRCSLPVVLRMKESYSQYLSWTDYLQQLKENKVKVNKERIASFEREVSTFCLPNNPTLIQLTTIIHDSEEYIKAFEKYMEVGINSFDEQRRFHLICKKALYVRMCFCIKSRLILVIIRHK